MAARGKQVTAAKLPTVRGSRRVRAGSVSRSMTPAEVADLLGVPEERIVAALKHAKAEFFPHASHNAIEGWMVPAHDVRRLLGGLEPLLTIRQFAEVVGLSYHAVHRAIRAGHVRTVGPAWLSSPRIPSSEYYRFRGDKGAPRVP